MPERSWYWKSSFDFAINRTQCALQLEVDIFWVYLFEIKTLSERPRETDFKSSREVLDFRSMDKREEKEKKKRKEKKEKKRKEKKRKEKKRKGRTPGRPNRTAVHPCTTGFEAQPGDHPRIIPARRRRERTHF